MIQGITNFLTSIFEFVTKVIDAPIGNLNVSVGLAIIIFSLLFKLVLFPLNIKQIKSSFKMKELQPELQKIQAKYKNDPQKLNEAQMKLYKDNGANPFSGCLPLLIQYPVLIAMFYVFKGASIIHGNGFLWIPDLSLKDPYMILPILTGITSYISMIYTSKQTQAQNTPGQSMTTMNIVMSGMMLFISLSLNSAVVLYYVIGNLFQMLQTWGIQKFLYNKEEIKTA